MSRIPPSLLYLTIYNPTLRPTGYVSSDDEDAEEQAHILFYTSKERAVSRDQMLRQVGLAKALVNFSEMFSATEPCNSIHSQSKRLVMVSPEPNFWIHAAVEPAKSLRLAVDTAKGKGKSKDRAKAKDKEKDKGKAKEEPPAYDYHDGSVHDSALCAHLKRGYEMFKLTHGSLTSILSTLGQEALELQLERFFTVWAWKWDFDNGPDLCDDLGVSLHPLYRLLLPLLDTFASELLGEIVPIVISSPHLIPSTRFNDARYPPSLSRHLLSLTLSSRPSTMRRATDQTINASPNSAEHTGTIQPPSQSPAPLPLDPSTTAASFSGGSGPTFLGMPTVSVNMDVRKWSWPGVLSFGKTQGKKTRGEVHDDMDPGSKEEHNLKEDGDTEETQAVPVNVDTSSLEAAMASDARSAASSVLTNPGTRPDFPTLLHSEGTGESETMAEDHLSLADAAYPPAFGSRSCDVVPLGNKISSSGASFRGETALPSLISLSTPAPEFMSTMVHLPDGDDSLVTKWRKVLYLGKHDMVVALVERPAKDNHIHDLSSVADKSIRLLEDICSAVEVQSETLAGSLPSATKILQPKDRHVISRDNFIDSSPGFAPKSEQFYNGRELLDKDSDISEVFSRGQNPQHWHVTRRGLGADGSGNNVNGEVLLEVSRKEASLTDVDNVLVSVVKRFN